MIVENWEIRIGGLEDAKKAFHAATEKDAGKKILFLTPRQLPRVFSEERLKILRAVNRHPEAGVVELARILGRHQEAVSRDLGYLRAVGMVSEGVPVKTPNKKPSGILFNVSIPA